MVQTENSGTNQVKQPKIHFVTGKGGVGKSVVAAAIAQAQASKGQKTLLVELGYSSFYQDFFELPRVEYQAHPFKPNFDICLWSGPECLKEYALHLLKVEALYHLFFENSVSKALINIAPALPELAMLGKLTSDHRKVGERLGYDVIVVDAFSTGHFLAMIRAPSGMAQTVKFGPMGDQSRAMDKIIRDSAICEYHVVSLPEEMPVLEAIELATEIEKATSVKPQHILNKFTELPAEAANHVVGEKWNEDFLNSMNELDTRQKWATAKLATEKLATAPGPELKVLNYVFEFDPRKLIENLSAQFSIQAKISKEKV